jgi:polyisoprenyl-teichoic acid--peptidoglycan teichoic acid transferase
VPLVVAPEIAGISDWQPLAKGGFATVWRARQEALDRDVAIKVDERPLDTETERRRFLGEAKTAGNLSGHPGIVTVHDAGILRDGRPYLVMKLCTGGSLTAWLRPDNRQSVERVTAVGVRIADALAVVHQKGMLHRDVKPPNILIDSYGNPGLTDFGLAAPEPGASTGLTLAFAPPEVLLGKPHAAASDVYQLAATIYALLCGRPPSDMRGRTASVADRVARLREPVERLPGIDARLMQLLRDGLAFDPADRPTAAQFRDRLAALQSAGANGLGRSGSTAAKSRPPARRLVLTLVAATVVSLLVLLFGASGVYLYEIDRSVTANINREIDLPPEVIGNERRPVKDPVADETLQYLLIGTDAGDPTQDRDGRSDSLMLLHLNEGRDKAYVISIPRNLMVDIPGQGQQRINAAYALGEAPLVVRTLEQLTGSRIDHVAMIDFRGFVNLTETLEGVTVRNRVAFSSHGYSYPVGNITLSGDAALWYVRELRGLPSELNRTENQRNVLKAILSKGLSPEVVADPLKFTEFVGNAAKQIRVDRTLTNGELRSTAASLRLTPNDITLISAPLGKEQRMRGQRVYAVDRVKLAELSEALRTDTMAAYVKKYPQG